VGDGVGVDEVVFSCTGLVCGFVAAASTSEDVRCSEMSVRSFFFGSVAAGASSNLPCTIIPDSRLATM